MNCLLSYGFRPFFLMTGLYAVVLVVVWVGLVFGGGFVATEWNPLFWHSHEMLYGMVPAAIAGFLLTAVPNWTGAKPLAGNKLLALLLLWLVGRLAFLFANMLPAWLVVLLDGLFIPVLAIYVSYTIWVFRSYRNLIVAAVLVLLGTGNALMLLGFILGRSHWLSLGQHLGLDLIALLMVIIAGRITPVFSANWLRNRGLATTAVVRKNWLDGLAIGSVGLLLVADIIIQNSLIVAYMAVIAGGINGLRLVLWSGYKVIREPLLWVLHLGYAWIVFAFLLRGGTVLLDVGGGSLWQHALGVGAIGTLLLGVMTRVAVGHTGRPLKLVPFGAFIYCNITLAAIVRLLSSIQFVEYSVGIRIAALLWVAAFGQFLWQYWPILSRPRVDGRPA